MSVASTKFAIVEFLDGSYRAYRMLRMKTNHDLYGHFTLLGMTEEDDSQVYLNHTSIRGIIPCTEGLARRFAMNHHPRHLLADYTDPNDSEEIPNRQGLRGFA